MSEEEKKCDCKEKCCKKVKEFLFISGAVFVGGTLAIVLGSALTRPKMPQIPQMMPQMGIERQMPSIEMDRQMPPQGEFQQKGQRHEGMRPDEFQKGPQQFGNQKMPELPAKK